MAKTKTQIKRATRNVRQSRRPAPTKEQCLLVRGIKWIWKQICAFGRWVWRMLCAFWDWLCNLNLIALLNLTLLIAIIVLFSMLIMDFTSCGKKTVVVVEPQTVATQNTPKRNVKLHPQLPIKQHQTSVNVVPVKSNPVADNQIAKTNNDFMGDTIIDSRSTASLIKNNATIHGNLYLQNMTKYTLPCNVQINGNLFLRNLGMLQFCGKFTVSGNIYVSPRSSFGPLPRNARIGGQIIL